MSVKDKLEQIISPQESGRFLCLELSSAYARATVINADDDELSIESIDYVKAENEKEDKAESVAELINNLNLPTTSKTIILGDSSLALTVPAWVSVTREDYKREVDEGELENIISQAVWKFLNHYQPKAVATFDVSDTEVMLANIRILGVRVNGHKVLNPIGFKARTIEFLIEETFVNRDSYKVIEENLPQKTEIVFISQIGVIDALLTSYVNGFDHKFNMLRLLPNSALVISGNGKGNYIDKISSPIIEFDKSFDWTRSHLLKGIKHNFNIEEEAASSIYDTYLEGEVSFKVKQILKDLIETEWGKFIKDLKKHLSGKKENIITSDFDLPKSCIDGSFKNIDTLSIIDKLGFKIDEEEDSAIFTALAGFMGYHFSKRGDELNKLAERRAKWLIP